jgi:hypothetical protein
MSRLTGILIGISKGGKATLLDAGEWSEVYLKARDISEKGLPKGYETVEAWERPAAAYSEDGSRKGQMARLAEREAEREKVAKAAEIAAKEKRIAALEKELAEAKGTKPKAQPKAKAPVPTD